MPMAPVAAAATPPRAACGTRSQVSVSETKVIPGSEVGRCRVLATPLSGVAKGEKQRVSVSQQRFFRRFLDRDPGHRPSLKNDAGLGLTDCAERDVGHFW